VLAADIDDDLLRRVPRPFSDSSFLAIAARNSGIPEAGVYFVLPSFRGLDRGLP
jgi:hypothetical protein